MSALLRRLIRLWGQSRIRLPRRPAGPEEIGPGDRLQIGSAVWRVQGRLRLATGGWMFRLEAVSEVPGEREARLVVPRPRLFSPDVFAFHPSPTCGRGAGSEGSWLLIHGGAEELLPPECVVVFSQTLTNRGPSA
jgi:hypothetical protein